MKNTIADLNVHLSKSQKGILNTLVNENNMLAAIPVKPATHGIYNVYSNTTMIDQLAEVDFDQELPTVGVSFELGQANLAKIGGTLAMPQDAASLMGGYRQYANDRLPKIIASAGNAHESRLYYNGFLKRAIETGNYASAGGATPNKQFSMVAVHFDMDSTVGLYNPYSLNNGKLFTVTALNGGNEYKVPALNNAIGKEIAIYMHYGLQLADERYVKAIVNIEPSQDTNDPDKIKGLPTGMMIDDLINDVRGNSGNTVIFCNPIITRYLGLKYNLGKRTVTDANNANVSYEIYTWSDIAFVTSHNIFKGTEAVVA